MIARLSGTYSGINLNQCIVDVNGVGYLVFIPVGTAEKLKAQEGEKITLAIHTSVREDAIQLYGFKNTQDKSVFSKLVSVSGIGPKIGLAILSDMSASQIATAIQRDDLPRFVKIPGIGKKTGQRLLLELKSKFDDIILVDNDDPSQVSQRDELSSALQNLGYKSNQVDGILERVRESVDADADFETLLKKALQLLS